MQQTQTTSQSSPYAGEDRRAWERVPIAVFGRCMLASRLEIPCQAINISPGDLGVVAAHTPKINDQVIIYLDHIGRVEGSVIRIYDGGFAILIDATPRKREKLSSQIEWLKANGSFDVPEGHEMRKHERIAPRNANSEVKLSDGRVYPTKIIDISLSGAALKLDVRPAIGTKLSLSGMAGKVVRHFDDGIAIEFATIQSKSNMKTSFG